ncbi:hypothetical protein JAAARDRAFT_48207 [Jaapia argillacea MUCL 33604]|uniref:CCHC-type domain-containing protein n=1 Tax=Jaapia argillacea MUCL 33604 TaxID=933084 RepID=A0A067PYC5_9AGAM|nr:hypothetical protein JAAARDRAFT_48207 [Jaapia argillacea MUCL 33604]
MAQSNTEHQCSTFSVFAKLNDSNYFEWAIMMEAELVQKKYWDLVLVEVDGMGKDLEDVKKKLLAKLVKRSTTKMAEACAEIILRVDGGQLAHMRAKDPRDVWENLKSVHWVRGFTTSLVLRRCFLTGRKGTKQSMQGWIGQVHTQAFAMEESGVLVSKQDMILALTMGLPLVYDSLIITFDSTPPKELTLNVVITHLINEETHQSSSTATTSHYATRSDQDVAMAVNTRDCLDVTCFFCDGKGHYKSDCPEKRKWEASKGGAEMAAVVNVDLDLENEAW